ncbi:hypothetical protein [Parapedobacter indicus]|uniref:Uncharacterized protein n=1 Tax=Parapedobacter indicus TaxID=1477437 RepID=A0A1I3IGZ1_9SPHI|nr:hypothetical protein [Parapedobacter indicus]PPL02163.1 hypothetical protein CLV26_10488 [Parapedobacter indicus]SFI47186.1 hypothetical protein SAMN05444682_10488 [Parapedobacter indicus]
MKANIVRFKQPINIIQIFRNIHIYGKEEKSHADRAARLRWKEISSQTGYVRNGQLFLPESIVGYNDFNSCDLIILEDENNGRAAATNRCFHQGRRNRLDIFEIKYGSVLELHLRYDLFEVGLPKRNDFKLCELKTGEPAEIKINGKLDHTLTAGMARTFKEQHYIFEYLGNFNQCQLLREPYPSVIKTVPSHRKTIDLIKPLW